MSRFTHARAKIGGDKNNVGALQIPSENIYKPRKPSKSGVIADDEIMDYNLPKQGATHTFDAALTFSRSLGSRLSFMDLPLEIRNIVYSMCLISSTPLLAWSGMSLEQLAEDEADGLYGRNDTPLSFDVTDYRNNALPVERQMLNLSLVCRNVYLEATEVFWTHNTFRFMGSWIWDTVLQWLIGIGPTKRGYITCLELKLVRLQYVWQVAEPLGARAQLPHRTENFVHHTSCVDEWGRINEMAYPRNKHLVLSMPKTTVLSDASEDTRDDPDALVGAVENISPKLEVVLKMLARAGKWSKVTIAMLLPPQIIPGISFWPSSETWMSMDLPNVIESCLATHAADGRKEIEVLWKCQEVQSMVHAARQAFEKQSWEIISQREGHRDGLHDVWDVYFTMKRRKVEGPFIASAPCPYEIYDWS